MLRSEFDKKKKLYTIGCSLYSFETKYSSDGIRASLHPYIHKSRSCKVP